MLPEVNFAALIALHILKSRSPQFDTPSHFASLFAAYPQFAGQTSDGNLCMVDPSNNATYDFLAAVWGELFALFPDAQMRIGGDELQARHPLHCACAGRSQFATMLLVTKCRAAGATAQPSCRG